ncbi:unnamed protein product [Spirodela intermedia]|uniref:FK506-binding protein n=1 Tax=Spirodela intermedia TaxID=51605 RepID=A0A7I8IEQ5_SPIIN|nr:unnamed protein product [Spirodela intermedia]CAA6656280.1 unnamed protein product [Spirodela intermedia]
MAFWGLEVKPGKPYTLVHDSSRGALRITQATLGNGTASKRTVVQCSVGDQSPVLLCSLLPDKSESCSLDLEFEEEDEVVFSVDGPRSVHLTGYFVNDDSFEEDVWEMGSEGSSSGDSENEYGEGFISGDDEDDNDDDIDIDCLIDCAIFCQAVVIEEISEDEKPSNRELRDRANVGSQSQIVKYRKSPTVESEDEDGFPVSMTKKTDGKNAAGNKKLDSKIPNADQKSNDKTDSINDEKPKKRKKDKAKNTRSLETGADQRSGSKSTGDQKKDADASIGEAQHKESNKEELPNENASDALDAPSEVKNTQKEKKMRETDAAASEPKKIEAPRKPRTFANGLIIEELSMGQPDGKRASPGKTVFVHYIGKLKNGKIFDSNIGQRPFKFRLGNYFTRVNCPLPIMVGQVIKGWDVGVDGMRVGDKRRLTIPPSMGYGQKGAGGAIPGNSWLLFDVELVDVK